MIIIHIKKDIHAETRKQLNDPLYQNIILPKQLDKEIANSKILLYTFTAQLVNIARK